MLHRKPLLVCSGILSIALAIAVVQTLGTKPVVAAEDAKANATSMPKKGEPLKTQDVSLDQAHAIIAAAVKKAEEMHLKMDVAVVDAGGNLKAFVRMDGA